MENTDVAKVCSAGHKNYWRCRISCACKGPEGTLISWFSLLSASISLSARSIVPKYSTNHITLWLKNLSLSCMTCLFENLYTDITLGSQAPHQHTPIAQLTQKPSGSREARETLSRQDPSINIQIITGKKNHMLVKQNKTVSHSQPAGSHTTPKADHSKLCTQVLFAFLSAVSFKLSSVINVKK